MGKRLADTLGDLMMEMFFVFASVSQAGDYKVCPSKRSLFFKVKQLLEVKR
jgi:hypothetical protein